MREIYVIYLYFALKIKLLLEIINTKIGIIDSLIQPPENLNETFVQKKSQRNQREGARGWGWELHL